MVTNFGLIGSGAGPQVATAQGFIATAIAQAQLSGNFGFDVTYVGHSLGGFIAQAASAGGVEGEVVAFNSPGAGGFLDLPQDGAFDAENYTYVYSDPATWSLLDGAIHSVGNPLSDNIFFVPGAESFID